MNRVEGKVAIVTGAARGIGAAIARRLMAEGARVVMTDIQDELGATLAQQLGSTVRYLHQDVTIAGEWAQVVATAEAAFGAVNVLVNNAGIVAAMGPIETVTEADFRRVIDVNLISVFLGMQAVLPSMKRAGKGSIVNISSMAGIVGVPQLLAYTAAKFGVRGMTKTAALDFSRYGIRVNSVHPGNTETTLLMDHIPPDQVEKFKRTNCPLGRLGTPEEIADSVLFLASDESGFATGAEFIIDGGATAD